MCPTCVDATHTRDCLSNIQQCKANQVCGFEELQSTRNCTSGEAFAPHEHCTLCCRGDDCARDLGLVQEEPSATSSQVCEDADFYPCQFAQFTACHDEDMSLTVCPVTCGRCADL
ncbi:hypothetical protein ElyMa_004785000 [Elysia marginata]|uniref:ShKT domain-containing protein n=1 Tax=Elysia marginata TaxID=1093978 RepID=A0AAV4IHR3_9GAST|nr:hypothetical protein ElyMa_004785000 [Elysia marginata]